MEELIKLQKKIVPEITDLLERRYNILRAVYYNQPAGRRAIAEELNIGERIVRGEVNFLRDQNLLNINTEGMTVTESGEQLLEKLSKYIFELKGLSDIEEWIKNKTGLKNIIIVPGDMEGDSNVSADVGRTAGEYIKGALKDNSIIALTGGTTVQAVVDNFPEASGYKNIIVVPARGGVGKSVENQANTLAAKLAKKMGGSYKLLHSPDNIGREAMEAILKEKEVKDVLEVLKKTDLLIHGIGRMDKMAFRRGLENGEIQHLQKLGAVGEAFGCYFDRQGRVVYASTTIGIKNELVKNIKVLVAVAGGSSKAEAILSVIKNNNNMTLVTDEGAAKEILRILDNE